MLIETTYSIGDKLYFLRNTSVTWKCKHCKSTVYTGKEVWKVAGPRTVVGITKFADGLRYLLGGYESNFPCDANNVFLSRSEAEEAASQANAEGREE